MRGFVIALSSRWDTRSPSRQRLPRSSEGRVRANPGAEVTAWTAPMEVLLVVSVGYVGMTQNECYMRSQLRRWRNETGSCNTVRCSEL